MFSYPLECGHCNNLVDFVFGHTRDHTARTPEQLKALKNPTQNRGQNLGFSITTLNDDDKVTASAHSHCPRCLNPTLILFECSRVAYNGIKEISKTGEGGLTGGSRCISVTNYYPRPHKVEQDPFWPDQIRKYFEDVQNMQRQGITASIVLSTCRTILEMALKELSTDENQSLFKRIESLHSNGVITSPIKDWAHSIRLDGNDATHDGKGEKNAADEYIEFLKFFLNISFSLPKRIQERRSTKN